METGIPSFAQQRTFYDSFWNDAGGGLGLDEKCRRRFILDAVRKVATKPLRILDLGCGRGWLTHELCRYGQVVGVDLSVKEARRRYPQHSFIEANIAVEFPGGPYDVVVSSEVIEHLAREHQAAHVKKAGDVLSKGGLLVLTTPNKAYMDKLIKKQRRDVERQPLEHWLGREELLAMVKSYFSLERFGTVRFYPLALFSSILLRAPYHLLYDYFAGYRIVDALLESTDKGAYLALAATKR